MSQSPVFLKSRFFKYYIIFVIIRERYRIIYTWKILENLVPNVNGYLKYKDHRRLGRMCVSKYAGPDNSKLRDSTLTIQAAKLFNAMPKNIRNLKNIPVDKFKNALGVGGMS